MNRPRVFQRRHTQRRIALDNGLRIINEHGSSLTPQGADTLRRDILAGFVGGEVNDAIHKSLGPEALRSALFGNTPGRRR